MPREHPRCGRMERVSSPARPNLLLVVTDDQGPWALGRETPELITPTLDRLADEGTVLSRFFCASPVCSPARASMLTGRMPSAHGIHDWLRAEGLEREPGGPSLLDPGAAGTAGIDTIGAMLARGGYRCALAGKWHVGPSGRPAAGYAHWYAHRSGGGPYHGAPIWEMDETRGRPVDPPRPAREPRYLTEAIGERALEFLARHRAAADDAPFFLHLTPTAPHDPWAGGNHPAELRGLYDGTDFPHVPSPPWHPWFRREAFPGAVADRRTHLVGYAAAVTGVDRMLGRVIRDLAEHGELERTIILFTSDNGFSCGHHGIWGKGNGTWPLNFWDSSVRVPFIARGPGIAAGRTTDALVSSTSLYETIAELTDVAPRPDPWRAGRSAAGLLRAGPSPASASSDAVVVHDEYGAHRMIRTAQHVYVTRREGPAELYDLHADPGEERNLSEDPAHRELRAALHERLGTFFRAHARPETDGWHRDVDGDGQD